MGYQPGRRRLATHTSLLNARTHSQSTEQSAHSMYTHTRTLRHSTRAEPPPAAAAAAASSKQQQRNSSKRVRVKRSRTQQSAASKNVKKTTESALLCSALFCCLCLSACCALRSLSRLLSFCGENKFSVLCAAACDSERERKSATILHCRSQRAWLCVCV